MLPKEDRELIAKIGRYKYRKMKEAGFDNFNNYAKFRQEQKLQNKLKYDEKNKIRFKTIRYIERYCNLEMKCQICGERAEIHHPNYKDYLKVNLLCKKHHTQLHKFELIPPSIIDLEKIKVREPPKNKKEEYIQSKIELIKQDILYKKSTLKDVSNTYKISMSTIKRRLLKEDIWLQIEDQLKQNNKRKRIYNSKHNENPLLTYKKEHNVTSKEISESTNIPLPTIRAIEYGKIDIRNMNEQTRQKLFKLQQENTN